MDVLGVLEKKLANLLEYVARLKSENELLTKNVEQKNMECAELQAVAHSAQSELASLKLDHTRLREECAKQQDEIIALKKNIEMFESSVMEAKTDLEDFHQEKALTKMLVDDLISSIDSLVEQEQ